MAPTVADRTEAELIALVQAHLPPAPDWLILGIGDDAAVVEPVRNRLEVLTVDALVEGVHFDRRFAPPEAVGHRALAVNLSDLAAMGAQPRLALLSLALPSLLPLDDFDRMIAGFASLAAAHGVHLIGGNLTSTSGPLVLDVTVTGSVKRRGVLRRAGARPGDHVYVSGTIGAGAAGLIRLRTAGAAAGSAVCVERYLRPQPRVRLGMLLGRNRAASACVDLSDGLADGVHQIARASGVGMHIDADAVPIEEDARACFVAQGLDPLTAAVTGGDDYELLFTVRNRLGGRLRTAASHSGTVITRIGVCTAEPDVVLRSGDSNEPMPRGFGHFR